MTTTKTANLSDDTFAKIKQIGKFGDSVDIVINKALTFYIKATHRDAKGRYDGKGG
jgi:hypothetical protein